MISIELRNKEVRDLNFASVLLFKNYKLLKVIWKGNRAYWIFDDDIGDAENVIRDYINGSIKGNIKKFVSAQNEIKQTLFNRD